MPDDWGLDLLWDDDIHRSPVGAWVDRVRVLVLGAATFALGLWLCVVR